MERLRVEPFYDPLVDHDGEATGRRVEVPGSPLVMMNGIERLQPGPVKSVAVPATLAPGQQVAVRIDAGPELVLAATGTPGREGTPESALIRDYRLSAAVEAANQALVNQPVPTAWLPRMLWAGDLDRDGRVDLLMDVSTTYSSRKLVLFLSSSNLAGQVFGAVAGFVTSGC